MKSISLMLIVLGLVGCGEAQEETTVGAPASCETAKTLPSGTACLACDGGPIARATGGPDGWCDFDGTSCACHGHGADDSCAQLAADFAACR